MLSTIQNVKPCQPQPSDRPSSPLTRSASSGLDDSGKQEGEDASAKMDQRPLSAISLTPNNSQQPCTNEQVWSLSGHDLLDETQTVNKRRKYVV